jgi:molybdenum cofactor biosynthesis protein B
VEKKIIKDEINLLQEQLKKWIASPDVDAVIATGGTGVTGRDITPEAFEELYEKSIPGFGELFRMLSYESIRTSSLQSRCTAGVANGTFLFALPGSTGACKDGWDQILVHQLDSTHKPCNLVELMPRLLEK